MKAFLYQTKTKELRKQSKSLIVKKIIMEFLFALPVLFIPLLFPVIGGCMAKCYGRKFWFWFWFSLLLPFISLIILLCLPDISIRQEIVLAHEGDEFGVYQ